RARSAPLVQRPCSPPRWRAATPPGAERSTDTHQGSRERRGAAVKDAPRDLTRDVLAVLLLGALLALSLWILRPFLSAILWATTIVVATWPLMCRVERRLWGRRWLAVTVMTAALLLVFIIPFTLAAGAIAANAEAFTERARSLIAQG